MTFALLLALGAAPCQPVSTVDELLAAIGPERCLQLAEGVFDFTSRVEPVRKQREVVVTPFVSIFSPQRPGHGHFEGGLSVRGVHGLTLVGAGADKTRLVQRAKPAPVLVLLGGGQLELRGLTFEGALIVRHVEGLGLADVSGERVLLDDVHDAAVSGFKGELLLEDTSGVRLEAAPRSVRWSRDVTVRGVAIRGGREAERTPSGAPQLDRNEVTFAQWGVCADAGACTPLAGAANQPATPVTLKQARAYCAWRGARLPTSAEWLRGARGVDARPWPWGFAPLTCRRAAVSESHDVADGPCLTGAELHDVCTHPEGNSPSGLCDLVGNAWEWTNEGLLRGGDVHELQSLEATTRPAQGVATGVRCARTVRL